MSTPKAPKKTPPKLSSNTQIEKLHFKDPLFPSLFTVNSIESKKNLMETSTVVCTKHNNGRCGNRCEHNIGDAFHYHTHFRNLFRNAPCCQHQKRDYERKNEYIRANFG